ncbi:ornithine cyclodeaminase family protein [Paenibacillus hamazuiensis]|uniref:ornithine cyclodeaminase family protein n=1 Tax=Paenibacillus hamazuiensis TaxID=2936508 RepID=UPI00200EC61E|nr:ornithine cyclodeaminase family protein [Paenibacillus hamazuiensis]
MHDGQIVYLSEDDVRRCGGGDFAAVQGDVRHAFALHAQGEHVLPAKVQLAQADRNNGSRTHYIVMPAFLGGDVQMAGMKWVRVGKPESASPAITSLMLLADHSSGEPAAIIDATWLNGIRTAAVTAVAALELANPESTVLAIVGSGAQGKAHLRYLPAVFPRLREIRIYSRRYENARYAAEEIGGGFRDRIVAVRHAEEAVRDADIVVSATTASEPVIREEWLKEGVFYAQIGSHECTFEAVAAFDKIVVDDWQQQLHRGVQTLAVMARLGKWSERDLHGTLGERLTGRIPGRESEHEKIMFGGIGLGIVDIAIAARLYQTALKERIGLRLPFSGHTEGDSG